MSQHVDTADQFDPIEESSMSLMEHLIELRTRLMWIGGAVIIATLIAMIFAWDIVEILNRPLGDYVPQAIGPTDNLVVFFKVALASGAAFAMPVIMYQLIAFIAPGLYPHERRALFMILPGGMALFITGVVFAFFIMIPPAIRFLQGFGGDNIRTEWTASLYISFITRITFWIGVAFQAPLVVGFLARIGLISGPQLLRFWRQAIVFIAIAAAFITPTIDPVNMTIVMGPLIVLFFFSVGIAYLMYRPRDPRDFSEGFIPDEYRDGDDDDSSDDSGSDDDDDPPTGGPGGSSGGGTAALLTQDDDAAEVDTTPLSSIESLEDDGSSESALSSEPVQDEDDSAEMDAAADDVENSTDEDAGADVEPVADAPTSFAPDAEDEIEYDIEDVEVPEPEGAAESTDIDDETAAEIPNPELMRSGLLPESSDESSEHVDLSVENAEDSSDEEGVGQVESLDTEDNVDEDDEERDESDDEQSDDEPGKRTSS